LKAFSIGFVFIHSVSLHLSLPMVYLSLSHHPPGVYSNKHKRSHEALQRGESKSNSNKSKERLDRGGGLGDEKTHAQKTLDPKEQKGKRN
jgi:hypothetical protein